LQERGRRGEGKPQDFPPRSSTNPSSKNLNQNPNFERGRKEEEREEEERNERGEG
jgi:hypothetical protein